jgi:CopG family transcriptional regulator/antitoxin EndoAI
MAKRINIILPDKTIAVLDRVTTKGTRSQFIDRAVKQLVATQGRANLRARLTSEAIENADRDLQIAAEWFPLEEEASETFEQRRAQPTKTQPRRTKRT